MRFAAILRCSGSALALSFSSIAFAQTATVPVTEAPSDPTPSAAADAATTAGTPAASTAATAADDTSTIVVTGIRQSLKSTRNLKRNSVQVIDSVVAEDIGKLPDIAVSDTAARIPGVQVVRVGGEASGVLVRGLPNFSTTYNGREIFTAETRVVALQDFPSSNIAALEVFKTSTANLVEPGLAGLVNVRSRRPFDFKKGEISASVWGLYTRQGRKVTPNFNVLLTDRWETGIGDIGILVNASRTEMQYLDSEPSNTDFLATPSPTLRFPDIQRLFYRSGNRVRPSANVALQWRPSPGLEFYVEGLYQGFRNKIDDRLLEVPLYGATYSNLVYRNGSTNLLRSGTATNPGNTIFTFQGATYNKTDTYQFAAGGSYESGPFRVTADVARTKSTFTGSTESLDRRFNGGYTVDFNLDTPEFRLRDINLNDPAATTFQGLYEQNQRSSGKDWQARLDTTYRFDNFFIRDIQIGARYTDRSALRQFSDRYNFVLGQNISGAALPVRYELTNPGFRGTDIQPTRSFFSPTYDSIRNNIEALRALVGYPSGPPAPFTQYTAKEETVAGYVQANFAFGDAVDGTIGIRATKATTKVIGTAAGLLPNPGKNGFEFLPNANLRWHITHDLQLRLAATQTITRPVFADLNPATSLGPPPNIIVPNPSDPYVNARRGNSGNPFLQPLRSDNYDASLEYYFSPTGFVSVAAFRRDLSGFIQNRDVRFIDPTLGPLIISAPVNSGKGKIKGVELQLQTFFDFDFVPSFARKFGIQANYTYLDAKTGFPNAGNTFTLDRILGVSKSAYNLVGLYENGPVSARLTYFKRSPSLEQRDDRGDDLYRQTAIYPGRLDASLNLTLRDNATVFFDWTNILNRPYRQNFSSARAGQPRAEYVRFLRFEEETFSLGLRFRFGGSK